MKQSTPASPCRAHACSSKEFPYAGGELQDQRAQVFYDAHKWKEARAEYEKLASMLKDPANPTRQRALLRVAECREHPKGSPSLLASVKTRSGSGCGASLRALPGLSLREKRIRDVRGVEHPGGEISRQQMDRGRVDGRREITTGRISSARRPSVITSASSTAFPAGRYAYNAEWRIAWVAYLDRQPYADDKLKTFSCASIPFPPMR